MMLIAYLVVAGGGAVVSLSCSCPIYRHASVEQGHCCCEDHLHDRGHLHMDEACSCLHDHSTEIALYTSSVEDQTRDFLRAVVLELPADLVQLVALSQPSLEVDLLHYAPPLPPLEELVCGTLPFRAPPVVA